MHTSNLSQYGVVYGRKVQVFKRPGETNQKKYREPVLAAEIWYKTKVEAEKAAKRLRKKMKELN